jgi:hypothetical protein
MTVRMCACAAATSAGTDEGVRACHPVGVCSMEAGHAAGEVQPVMRRAGDVIVSSACCQACSAKVYGTNEGMGFTSTACHNCD